MYFGHLGCEAEQAARTTNPWERALELLTGVGEFSLQQVVRGRRTKLIATWTSAYGFLPDGSPNYAPETDQMVGDTMLEGPGRYLHSWRPFQLLDPLTYLTIRHWGNMWEYA
ncbi:MAG: hypothetical protein QM775_24500 [Pirellulales bacterium]